MDTNTHFFFSSRRRHTRLQGDWSSDVCSSDLGDSRGLTLQSEDERALQRAHRARRPSDPQARRLHDRRRGFGRSGHHRSEERRVGKERGAQKSTKRSKKKYKRKQKTSEIEKNK